MKESNKKLATDLALSNQEPISPKSNEEKDIEIQVPLVNYLKNILKDALKEKKLSTIKKEENKIQIGDLKQQKIRCDWDIFKDKVKPQYAESLNIILKYMEDSDLHKTNINIGAVALIVYQDGFMRKYINTYTKCLGLFERYFDIEIKDTRKSKYEKRADELRKTHAVIDNPTAEKAPYTRN